MYRKTAKTFWTTRDKYPIFGSKQRRFYQLQWLFPKLNNIKSLLSIGCGSGEFLDIILRTTDIEKIYGCDISENLLALVDSRIDTFVYDIYKGGELPRVDAVLLWASLQYIFDDKTIERLLKDLQCKKLFIRTPCNKEELKIDKYSEELKDEYSSRYMTLNHLIGLLEKHYTIDSVDRAYPEELDSKFGTKQWLIECTKNIKGD